MSSGPAVSLARHNGYDPDAVLHALRRLLEPLGGMGNFVRPGARVLLKPNLVFGRRPDRAVNTHPSIVRAAAMLSLEAGARRVTIGDSPGFGTARGAAKTSGILAVAAELGVEVVEFTPAADVDPGRTFVRLELAAEVLDADVVVNLAKMKTHGQMLMSLAVKNLFGTVPGPRKLQWHYRAGRDRLLFARALNEVALAARSALSILDGVVGMDEMGPTGGRTRPVGLLAAGSDPWALDAAIMDVLGVGRERLYTLAAALENGPHDWLGFRIEGERPEALRPADWRLPEPVTLAMHGGFVERHFPRLAAWLRSSITPLPVPNAHCAGCGHCVDACPATAMRLTAGKPAIDAALCIRCYCCHELCPHGGMDLRTDGLAARILGIRRN